MARSTTDAGRCSEHSAPAPPCPTYRVKEGVLCLARRQAKLGGVDARGGAVEGQHGLVRGQLELHGWQWTLEGLRGDG